MVRYFTLLLMLSLATVTLTSAASAEDDEKPFRLWWYVAASDTIAKGVLQVPVSEFSIENDSNGASKQVTIIIEKPELGKGTYTEDELTFRHRLNYAHEYIPKERLLELNGKTVIIFLNKAYPIAPSPWVIQVATDSLWSEIKKNVLKQQQILADYQSVHQRSEKPPLYSKVKRPLRKAAWRWTASQAYVDLEMLGFEAVPAMLMFIDDDRSVGCESISIVNREPDAWEGIGHFYIRDVHELLVRVLYLITGEYFAGSREQVCNAWRIYLHYFEELKPSLEQRAKKYKNPAILITALPLAKKTEIINTPSTQVLDTWEKDEMILAGCLAALGVYIATKVCLYTMKRRRENTEV